MQSAAKTIQCTAIQEIRVIALPVCKVDKPQEQSLRVGCSGSGSKGSLFGFTKNCSPNQAPVFCYSKRQSQTNSNMCSGSMLPVLFVVFYIVNSGFFYSNACELTHCPLREQTAFQGKGLPPQQAWEASGQGRRRDCRS